MPFLPPKDLSQRICNVQENTDMDIVKVFLNCLESGDDTDSIDWMKWEAPFRVLRDNRPAAFVHAATYTFKLGLLTVFPADVRHRVAEDVQNLTELEPEYDSLALNFRAHIDHLLEQESTKAELTLAVLRQLIQHTRPHLLPLVWKPLPRPAVSKP